MKNFGRLAQALAINGLLSGVVVAQTSAGPWEIGPIIRQHNYSFGLPRIPDNQAPTWSFAISPTAEPHYVTFSHGSLTGKTQIKMRFRVDGPPGAVVHGAKCPSGSPSAVTLYFQREGDDWATDGGRWWATFASVALQGPMAEVEIAAPLDANWTSVLEMTAKHNPNEFAGAKANADRVGFTFGNCEGFGHGARATMPVKFVVSSFEVL